MDKKVKIFAGLFGGLAILLIGAGCGPTAPDTTLPGAPTIYDVTTPTDTGTQAIQGTKEADTSIWLNGKEIVSNDGSNSWSYNLTLEEGYNPLIILAKDEAGNESEAISPTPSILYVNQASQAAARPQAPTLQAVTSPTNQTTQKISGTKTMGTSIWLNGNKIVDMNDSTTWNYDVTLLEGNNYLMVSAQDKTGNSSDTVTANIAFDDLPPITPVLSPVSPVTSVSTIILWGIKEAGSSVWLAASPNKEIIPLNDNTVWTYTYTFSSVGQFDIKVYSIDAAGNSSGENQVSVNYDPTAPNAPLVPNGVVTPTHQPNQVLSGTKDANSSILINGLERIPVNSATTWSYTVSLSEGTNSFAITSEDAAGNTSGATNTSIILDTAAPAAPGLTAVKTPTNQLTQEIKGTKEVGAAVMINGVVRVPFSSSDPTNWTYTFELTVEGANPVTATCWDSAGNESGQASASITRDTAKPGPPSLTAVTTPTNQNSQLFSGTKETNTSIWINGTQRVPMDSSTNWNYVVSLVEGNNAFSLTSRDAAENESTPVVATAVTRDTVLPSTPILIYPLNKAMISDNESFFDWTDATDASSGVHAYNFQTAMDKNFLAPLEDEILGGSWSGWTGWTMVGGNKFYWRVRARDAAGNWGGWSKVRDLRFNRAAGDFSNDRIADIIIGDPGYDLPLYGDAGRVYIYRGNSVPSWPEYAVDNPACDPDDCSSDYFGSSVAIAGDLNGDYRAEALVGAPQTQDGITSAGPGVVYVFSGYSLAATAPLSGSLTLAGQNPGEGFGMSVSGAGDLNDDGFMDVVVGAPYYNGGQGRVYLYLGGSPMNAVADQTINCPDPVSGKMYFGWSVASAGDFNDDGYDDIIVGAPGYENPVGVQTGRAYIIFGGGGFIKLELPLGYRNTTDDDGSGYIDDRFGYSVSGGGDYNYDGFPDAIVGAPYANFSDLKKDTGMAAIFYGPDAQTKVPTILDEQACPETKMQSEDYFGTSVADIGPTGLNAGPNDHLGDVVVGAPWNCPSPTGPCSGSAIVFTGSSQGVKQECARVFWGIENADYFGTNISGAGDLDGDGWNDFMAYAPERDYSGSGLLIGEVQVLYSNGVTSFINQTLYDEQSEGGYFGQGLGGKAN